MQKKTYADPDIDQHIRRIDRAMNTYLRAAVALIDLYADDTDRAMVKRTNAIEARREARHGLQPAIISKSARNFDPSGSDRSVRDWAASDPRKGALAAIAFLRLSSCRVLPAPDRRYALVVRRHPNVRCDFHECILLPGFVLSGDTEAGSQLGSPDRSLPFALLVHFSTSGWG